MILKFITLPKNNFYKWAFALAYVTILYNLIEGAVSVFFGIEDETLSLFGFGVDSFVEVISGIGIFHMLLRIRNNGNETRDDFERTALKITGISFYILSAALILSSVYNLLTGHKPDTTFWGIVISIISIITMSVLIQLKLNVGRALNSKAIIADANCTKTCLYLSVVLLISSVGYLITGIGGIDVAGAVLISYFSYKEGKEAMAKAASDIVCGCEHD